jgi:hypothetical protein
MPTGKKTVHVLEHHKRSPTTTMKARRRNVGIGPRAMTATMTETNVMNVIHEARAGPGVLRLTPSPAAAATKTNPALHGRTVTAVASTNVVIARALAHSLLKKTWLTSRTSRAIVGRTEVLEIKIETGIATGHEIAIARIRIRRIGAMTATTMTRSIDLATKTRRGTVDVTPKLMRRSATMWRRNTKPPVEAAKTATATVTATTRRNHLPVQSLHQ